MFSDPDEKTSVPRTTRQSGQSRYRPSVSDRSGSGLAGSSFRHEPLPDESRPSSPKTSSHAAGSPFPDSEEGSAAPPLVSYTGERSGSNRTARHASETPGRSTNVPSGSGRSAWTWADTMIGPATVRSPNSFSAPSQKAFCSSSSLRNPLFPRAMSTSRCRRRISDPTFCRAFRINTYSSMPSTR